MLGLPLVATFLWAGSAQAGVLQIGVEGMSCGVACPPRIIAALDEIDGVERVDVSFSDASACLEISSVVTELQIQTALTTANYTLSGMEVVPVCGFSLETSVADPWADTEGIDARVISTGQEFEIDAHHVEGNFTVFDFVASWCGPCHIGAGVLREQLRLHSDLSVRVVSLGDDPQVSFDYPVVAQHMAFASGLPWLIVVSPTGRTLYEGSDMDRVLRVIERRRD